MLKYLYLFTLVALLIVGVRPAGAVSADPALQRFFFTSNKYSDWVVKLNGRTILEIGTGELSDYVSLPAVGRHTLELWGRGMGIPNGQELVWADRTFQAAPGGRGIEIVGDDGVRTGLVDGPNAPRDKSVVHVIWSRGGTEVRFGGLRLSVGPTDGPSHPAIVAPQSGPIELRGRDGKLLDRRYLRAQPGYRYEVVVYQSSANEKNAHLTIRAVSPQLQARPTPTLLFEQTGHYLDGRLRSYWEETGALPVFGYPLNDDHLTTTPEGRFVTQVFERNRFEYHPEQQAPYDVLLGRLGDERLLQLGRVWRNEFTTYPIRPNACTAVPVDGRQFALCEPFRTYYQTHGIEFDGQTGFAWAESLALFGLPLTQPKMETNSSGDTVLTQWFERARFEYHPKNPKDQQVLLGRLGTEVSGLEPLTFDDEDRGFQRFSGGANAPDWNEAVGGFGGHFWWTCSQDLGSPKINEGDLAARWVGPQLTGRYEIQVFVPGNHAGSANVGYTVRVSLDEGVNQRLDQRPWQHEWVTLTTLELSSQLGVTVSSNTGERNCAHHLAADAIRLVPR